MSTLTNMLRNRLFNSSVQPKQLGALHFVSTGNSTVTFKASTSFVTDIWYQTSTASWEKYTSNTAISLSDRQWVEFENRMNVPYNANSSVGSFNMTGNLSGSGNIQSLMNYSDACTPYCYFNMFNGCSSLTTAPELTVTKLVNGCYSYMFNGCSALNKIHISASSFGSNTNNWLSGVSSSGTFYCLSALGTNDTIQRGASYCPTGWTVINID